MNTLEIRPTAGGYEYRITIGGTPYCAWQFGANSKERTIEAARTRFAFNEVKILPAEGST